RGAVLCGLHKSLEREFCVVHPWRNADYREHVRMERLLDLIDEKLGTFDFVGNRNFRKIKETIRGETVATERESECGDRRRTMLIQISLHVEPIARFGARIVHN